MAKMDRIDRFKKLCALKTMLESIDRRCQDDNFTTFHVSNMIGGSCLHIIRDLVQDAKVELRLNDEALTELRD